MQKRPKRRTRFVVAITMAVVWMAFIFYLSSQPASVSGSQSLLILKSLLRWVSPAFYLAVQSAEIYNESFRTFMHGIVFFILAILVLRVVRLRHNRVFLSLSISAAICVAYSLFDEMHQLLVPGRSFQLFDLLIDAAGTFAGIALYMLWLYIKNRITREER